MSEEHGPPHLVVGIGASAGGLEAFKALLSAIPPDASVAWLLVQHLDPTRESLLPELLGREAPLPVVAAQHGAPLRPRQIYVIQPNRELTVRDGAIVSDALADVFGGRHAVDRLFQSLAREYGSRACGVVLSGAGADGREGLREIQAVGGLTIAQDPQESSQGSMPRSAIQAGVVDLTLAAAGIPTAIARFAELPADPPTPGSRRGGDALSEASLAELAELLEDSSEIDLRAYKRTTIQRRLQRRMFLAGHEQVEDYVDELRADAHERERLRRDLLILLR